MKDCGGRGEWCMQQDQMRLLQLLLILLERKKRGSRARQLSLNTGAKILIRLRTILKI